ncbi:hypothetical protein Val02_71930 [Virgisporangium aliadipatigenens]|uniref:Uncharacterized protein n=1 Tax=Virgisporangium aliadipatigenens TaxID=741659 RepID=A0A8J4DVN6_9ACTN|nr:hypothetical protein [Virgisporangium aliadipatigenens]GIJ50307.1 hypothetical protein Val02_71930 [Virgisporangium aliadipatigenens]
MPEIRLTYWWNGHVPGDVVDVDETTARTLSVISVPASESEPEPPKDKKSAKKSDD